MTTSPAKTGVVLKTGKISHRQANFRKNLIRATGKAEDAARGLDAHHMLPDELAQYFSSLGLEIHDPVFVAWVKGGGEHQRWSKRYNDAWKEWLSQFKDRVPTLDEILAQAKRMAEEYSIDWTPSDL